MFVLTVIFVLPIAVILLSFVFGFILAGAESWSVMDGFYYVISTLCGLPKPLTHVTPESGAKASDSRD